MSSAKDVTKSVIPGVIVSEGAQNDPYGLVDQNRIGLETALNPLFHGPQVLPEHMGMVAPIRYEQATFPRPADPGSLAYFWSTTGSNNGLPMGQGSDLVNPETGIPGAQNLYWMNPFTQEAYNRKLGMNPPPDVQDTNERGAHIRKPQEKGQEYSHSLIKGLPSQASLYEMAAWAHPSVKNIETAKEHFANILGSGNLQSLASSIMSMGKMAKGMSNSNKQKIKENMRPELAAAFDSMTFLLQNNDTDDGYATDARVNEEVFMENAVDLFSQCTCVADLADTIKRLSTDKSLYGLDELENTVVEVSTPFGTRKHKIAPDGTMIVGAGQIGPGTVTTSNTTVTGTGTSFTSLSADDTLMFPGNNNMYSIASIASATSLTVDETLPELSNSTYYILSSTDQDAAQTKQEKQSGSSFANFMASSSVGGGCPAMLEGENMFGDSAKTMFDMMQRVMPQGLQSAIETIEKVNKEANAIKLNKNMRYVGLGQKYLQNMVPQLG